MGLLYWDTIEKHNMLCYDPDFQYVSTNPCGEIPMAPGNSCLLGSINLDKFVKHPFTKNAVVDFDRLREVTDMAVFALNDVLDEGLPRHPLQEQRDAVRDWRQIGLGTTSLGTMLMRLGVVYGSEKSCKIVSEIYRVIAESAIKASLQLARLNGAYPKCKPDLIVKTPFFKQFNFEDEIVNDVKKYGLRNCQLLTCAPNGSIGTMIGSGSTGIESVFALSYYRTTKTLDAKDKIFKVNIPIVQEYQKVAGTNNLPEYFVSVNDIDPIDRIKVQAAAQQFIDGSISSTCNCPEKTSIEDVKNIYISAWKLGCKGCTIFRTNCQRQAILSTNKKESTASTTFNSISPISRKQLGTTIGATHCKKCACGTLYITTNLDKDGNLVEVFTHTSKGGICQANLNAETRLISLGLRSGIKIEEIEDQLKGIHCPACQMAKAKGQPIDGMSCPDIISRTIKEFTNSGWTICSQYQEEKPIVANSTIETKDKCPECGEPLVRQSGCRSCPNCGFSYCG